MTTTATPIANPDVQRGLLGEAFENADAVIAIADEAGKYMAVNRRACEVFGYTREEFLERHVTDIAAAPGAEDRFRTAFERGRTEGEADALAKDGSRLSFRYWTIDTTVAKMPMLIGVGRLRGEPGQASG